MAKKKNVKCLQFNVLNTKYLATLKNLREQLGVAVKHGDSCNIQYREKVLPMKIAGYDTSIECVDGKGWYLLIAAPEVDVKELDYLGWSGSIPVSDPEYNSDHIDFSIPAPFGYHYVSAKDFKSLVNQNNGGTK